MDPILNPYVPGAGAPPPELAGRQYLLAPAEIALRRLLEGRSARSFIATGLRGVGKTVVLGRIREMATEAGFQTCFIEAHEYTSLPQLLAPHLRRMMLALDRADRFSTHVKRALRVLKSFIHTIRLQHQDFRIELDFEAETGIADSGNLDADLSDLFAAVGEAARARGTGILFCIDEIQFLSERDMGALIMALHRTARENLPVMFAGAGLPHIVAQTGQSRSYAERLFDFPQLGPLKRDDVADALRTPAAKEGVTFTEAAIEEVFSVTGGYPYFIQEWAYHAWNVAHGPEILPGDVRVATEVSITALDSGFFRMRYERLTPRERAYCIAMAELGSGPHRSGEIADRIGVRVQNVAPIRAALIRKGMIWSPAFGTTDFTVPLFETYLLRMRDNDSRRINPLPALQLQTVE
ncbi:MAG: AAA family ATPase [Acetobacter sp.]|jgi:DNA polymerase III delta prime subunit|nr:AAA family ATPase [Acetobacter sp.]MCH4062259.1 AAA family ATPase [Acetobacter sp.]MCH4088894.1 AAA family ATPase [Acetobacter sp.]MCI1292797.1 AAA family ATPase [Acetobacter sp.]MCI1319102.1 AAA family ATPase [Acetobacter sp.]